MHSGPELGAALKEAMRLKGIRQKDIASEFGVRQPSVSEWVKHGRIDKSHISHLMEYFADVVGPAHWGLPQSALLPTSSPDDQSWPLTRITRRQWEGLTERERGAVEDAAVAKLRELQAERGRLGGSEHRPSPPRPQGKTVGLRGPATIIPMPVRTPIPNTVDKHTPPASAPIRRGTPHQGENTPPKEWPPHRLGVECIHQRWGLWW